MNQFLTRLAVSAAILVLAVGMSRVIESTTEERKHNPDLCMAVLYDDLPVLRHLLETGASPDSYMYMHDVVPNAHPLAADKVAISAVAIGMAMHRSQAVAELKKFGGAPVSHQAVERTRCIVAPHTLDGVIVRFP